METGRLSLQHPDTPMSWVMLVDPKEDV